MEKKLVTIGFSIHRPEIIPLTAELMRRHDAVLLEEPPQPGFQRMLRGTLSIDDYLLPTDVEYPEFSRSMCHLLRELYQNGKKIFQVEPFLQHLLAVHTFFSHGRTPAELEPDSVRHRVYVAERDATGALLDYYRTVMSGSFEAAVEAIIRFARLDAARFRLRDSLRAPALAARTNKYPSTFVEAGAIHYALCAMLGKSLPQQTRVKPVFIAHRVLQSLGESGHLFGPGDLLTLVYIFHPDISTTQQQALLAARSLIYTKLVAKEESSADLSAFPHVQNELATIRTVRLLTLGDCARLFPLIRRLKTAQAQQLVHDYLLRFK